MTTQSTSTFSNKTLRQILKLATLVVTPRSLMQDRWGNPCGADVYSVRLGDRCILLSNFPDVGDPESPPQIEIEENVRADEGVRCAGGLFQEYGDGLHPDFQIKSAGELPDRTANIAALLDKLYEPDAYFEATLPSSILPRITTSDTALFPQEWAWFDDKLYLTKSVFRRTGLSNGRAFFDTALFELFAALKFNVYHIRLCTGSAPPGFHDVCKRQSVQKMISVLPDFRALVELSLKLERHEKLERELHSAKYDLKHAMEKANGFGRTVRNLENKLKELGLDSASL